MYTVYCWFVTPTAVRSATAMHRSPKQAFQMAQNAAWNKLVGCESIGVEGYTIWRDGKVIKQWCDLD